jgi:hypothetical protein
MPWKVDKWLRLSDGLKEMELVVALACLQVDG